MTNRIKKATPYLLICIAIIFLACQPSLFSPVKLWILEGFSLPLKIVQFPLKELKKIIFYRLVAQENLNLKNQINALSRRLVNQQEVLKENERLRRLLYFKNKSSFSLIAASVIAKDPSRWESVVIIDKGKDDGVKLKITVITELGLAGSVSEVGSHISKVTLINDPNFSAGGLLQSSREEGIVSGTINGICRMKYLSLNSDVKAGDIVVTSGLDQKFPKGILIGKVIEVEEDSSGLSRSCLIEPAVNLAKLEEVLLVIP